MRFASSSPVWTIQPEQVGEILSFLKNVFFKLKKTKEVAPWSWVKFPETHKTKRKERWDKTKLDSYHSAFKKAIQN